ncbi:hypothetical protein [Variovorax paradoxus]|uniref:hypothetical protein n=1 Tax=Variovorax paradoxus TaxID=34073 RepID=UPI00247A46DF
MKTRFRRHATVPPHTRDPFAQDMFKWSADFDVPSIAFVMQALEQYARHVAAMEPEALDTPMVSGHAWHGCAVEVRDKLARRLGRNEVSLPVTSPTQRR